MLRMRVCLGMKIHHMLVRLTFLNVALQACTISYFFLLIFPLRITDTVIPRKCSSQ
jgi:hypothetical protein